MAVAGVMSPSPNTQTGSSNARAMDTEGILKRSAHKEEPSGAETKEAQSPKTTPCPKDAGNTFELANSPDSFFNLIREKENTLTDIQMKDYFRSLEGRYVTWIGYVEEVKEKLWGGYQVLVDYDTPDQIASVQEMYLESSKDDAYALKKDQPICFVGRIESVVKVLGKAQVTLDHVNITAY